VLKGKQKGTHRLTVTNVKRLISHLAMGPDVGGGSVLKGKQKGTHRVTGFHVDLHTIRRIQTGGERVRRSKVFTMGDTRPKCKRNALTVTQTRTQPQPSSPFARARQPSSEREKERDAQRKTER